MISKLQIEDNGTGYQLREFTESDITYIITGKCNFCGRCCTNPNYNVGFNDENGRCTKLKEETIDGETIYICTIYNNRPLGCLLWPTNMDEINNNNCSLKITTK